MTDRIEPVLGVEPNILKFRERTGELMINEPITDYKIIQGLPAAVELEVKILLNMGWRLNGDLHSIKTPLDNHNGIVVQCMII